MSMTIDFVRYLGAETREVRSREIEGKEAIFDSIKQFLGKGK